MPCCIIRQAAGPPAVRSGPREREMVSAASGLETLIMHQVTGPDQSRVIIT